MAVSGVDRFVRGRARRGRELGELCKIEKQSTDRDYTGGSLCARDVIERKMSV